MPSVLQFPMFEVVQTKQSFLPQFFFLNGFDVCNWLLSNLPVRSTTLMRSPLFRISFSYFFFSSPFGVIVTNITESNPPSLYQLRFFCSFNFRLDCLSQSFGLCIGLIPNASFSFIFSYAFIAPLTTWYRKIWLYPEYCIFIMCLFMCVHATSHGRFSLQCRSIQRTSCVKIVRLL